MNLISANKARELKDSFDRTILPNFLERVNREITENASRGRDMCIIELGEAQKYYYEVAQMLTEKGFVCDRHYTYFVVKW